MRTINNIVVHASYTYPEMDIGVEEIRRWHTEENKWRDIGYHYVIRRDGTIEDGRPVAQAGAHVAGHNADSIGVCMVGGKAREGRNANNYTRDQWRSLEHLVMRLTVEHPAAAVKGHNDFTTQKTCPQIDIGAWWSRN